MDGFDSSSDFQFDHTGQDLGIAFHNKTASYKVYERPKEIGILIKVDGKTYNWIGDLKTKKGSLDRLLKLNLDNVLINGN